MIIGHETQQHHLSQLIKNQQLPQTILFSGTDGIGKQLVAKELAKTLICGQSEELGGCQNCEICSKFTANASPDFHYWNPTNKETSKPEFLRQLLKDLSLSSFSGGNRVLIIDNANTLSNTAANILLKSLEEPLENLYYILVTANAARLPITILSRCQKLVFQDLKSVQLAEIIKKLPNDYFENIEAKDLEQIAKFDLHSLTAIKQIDDNYELWQSSKGLFNDLITNKTASIKQNLKSLCKERDKLSSLIFFLTLISRHFLQTKLKKQAEAAEIEKWSIIINNLIEANYFILNRNLNANYLLSDILLDISYKKAQPISNYLE